MLPCGPGTATAIVRFVMVGRGRYGRSGQVLAVLLAAAWVPYLAIHCPSCPGAPTSLGRCGAANGAAHDGDHAEHVNHSEGTHHHSEKAPASEHGHEHAPGTDCCQIGSPVAATAGTSVIGPGASSHSAVVALLPAIDRTSDVEAHVRLARHGPPPSHSPPLFLLFQTLLC